MAKSLQDQLLAKGLINRKQAKKSQKAKAHDSRKISSSTDASNSKKNHITATQQQQDKKARDKALNKSNNEKKAEKEKLSQLLNILNTHSIAGTGDQAYNFVFQSKIKKVWVSSEQLQQLSGGSLEIVHYAETSYIVTPESAAKIAELAPQHLTQRKTEDSPAEDDPYKDFQIPDDLMW